MRKALYFLMLLVPVCTSAQSNEEQLVTFTKGQRATIILPVTPDADKGRYYRLDRVEDYQIVFEEEPHPQARVPYIIIPDEDFSIDVSTSDLPGIRRDSTNIYGVSFIGTYVKDVIGYKDSFYYYTIDSTSDCYNDQKGYDVYMGPLRAFLQVDWRKHNNQWVKMQFVLHDNHTSISTPSVQKTKNSKNHYNFHGQRINGLQKGLNIVEGKNVFVK
jgi:hypothetical protein